MSQRDASVLVLGNYRQTLTIIRSLGLAGYRVIAGRPGPHSFTDLCRYTTDTWQHPDPDTDPAGFVDAVNGFLAQRDFDPVVFPVGDTQIRCLAEHAARFREPPAAVMPDPATALTCQSKSAIYDLNQRLGIPQPRFATVRGLRELHETAARLGYPIVVKPDESHTPFFGKKAVIARSQAALRQLMPHWPEGHAHLVVQTFFEGQRHTEHFLAEEGEILAYFDFRVLRTDRPDGTGYLVDGVSSTPRPTLAAYTATLARGLRYTGIGSVQFLVDLASDTASFLEINPRLGAACALPYFCGYDFPRLGVELVEYRRGRRSARPGHTAPYRDGMRVVWTTGELRSILKEVRAGRLGSAGTARALLGMTYSLLRANHHASWWWRDPLPVLLPYYESLKTRLPGGRRRAT